MKKWLLYLLILITAAGTFIPCCLEDNCCAAQQTVNTGSHDKHTPEGACSPFFSCAACPGFVEVARPFQLVVFMIEKNIPYKKLSCSTLPRYASSFWQPPRAC